VSASDRTAKGAAETANTMAAALLETVKSLEADNADQKPGTEPETAKATVQGIITGKAEKPTSPSDPNVPLYLVAGLLAGLLVSVGVVAVREVLRGEDL
jgi:capsular polysaccharide biosynthesis protein